MAVQRLTAIVTGAASGIGEAKAPFEGSYRIWARGCSPAGGGADSFWLQIDKENWRRLDINIYSNQWGWRLAGQVWLKAGSHTLRIAPRDNGCRLDQLHMTTSEKAPEHGNGPKTN